MGIVSEMVIWLRTHAIASGLDSVATVSAPDRWHRLTITARESGHVVLAVRYTDLSTSRLHNLAGALDQRGWDLDEDAQGATARFPPGSEPTTAAFEILAALTLSGAPSDVRTARAFDADGGAVRLR